MPFHSHAKAAGIPLDRVDGFHNREIEAREAWAAWQAHVDAGRLGVRSEQSPEQRARHDRNERIICGPRVPRIWET